MFELLRIAAVATFCCNASSAPPPPTNTVLPTVSANPQMGTAETSTNGTWTGSPTFTYQWEYFDTTTNISGATASTYTPVLADVNHTLAIKVTGTNAGGSATATSAATGFVSFFTAFPATENPISQGGIWANGGTYTNWGNVRTVASGTPNVFGANQVGQFGDPIAVLTGVTMANNQQASATVNFSGLTGGEEEVELHSHMTLAVGNITGYEIDCSVLSTNKYILFVRWDPGANFTILTRNNSVFCNNGDTLSFTVASNVFNMFINGTNVLSWTDSTYPSGPVGIGFYLFSSSDPFSAFGFNDFKASNF